MEIKLYGWFLYQGKIVYCGEGILYLLNIEKMVESELKEQVKCRREQMKKGKVKIMKFLAVYLSLYNVKLTIL